jgi:multiple sugar transport system permease protein
VSERALARPRPWAAARRRSVGRVVGRIAVYLVVIAGAVLILLPFFWMISTSLKELRQTVAFPPVWIPRPIVWRNYPDGWAILPFTLFLRNTLVITVLATFGAALSSSLVAFGFSRLRAPGSALLFIILLSTLMLPSQVTLVPTFVLFRILGWVGTFAPLIVPTYFGGPFFIFLLRQFMMTVPLEMDDAARIDGCGSLGIYYRIMLPLVKAPLAAVAIFSFFSNWNDFLGPLIYLNREGLYTLAVGLNLFLGESRGVAIPPWNQLMAVSLVVSLPCLLVFFFAQRVFIQGIVMTGVKG